MAHDVAVHLEVVEGRLRIGHDVPVHGGQRAPRRRGLGDVGQRAAVEQVVADVGRVELLLVVELAGTRTDAEAAVALDDPPDELALCGDVVLGALVADERQAHGLEVEVAASLEVRREGLRLDPVDRGRVFLVAKENCVSFASDTRVTDGAPHWRRSRASRQGAGPVGEEVAEDHALLGHAMDVHRRLADDAEAPFAAQHHLAHARARRRVWHRPGGEDARGSHHADGSGQVGDVAVLVGLHPGRACGDPAPERRVAEAVGEVADRPPAGVELLLEMRAEDPRLYPGEACLVVDREHLVHPAQVDRDDVALLIHGRLEAARDVRAAAECDHDGIGVDRRRTTAVSSSSSAGRTTTSGSRPTSPRRWRIRSRRLLPRA